MARSDSSLVARTAKALALAAIAAALTFPSLPRFGFAQAPNRAGAEVYPDVSHSADRLLRTAAQHAEAKQWAEAVEIYQRVIQQFGEKLTLLPKDDPASDPTGQSKLFVDDRQYSQRCIAALPPEARALYRARVDGQAEQWFRQGAAGRDRALLRRIVDEAFCSSWGDDALELLGDLAFQDGDFVEALTAYRQLVPDRPDEASGLIHPDPSIDLARVAAKKLLCRASLAENPPTPDDLKAFAKAYPNAKGSLAGRTGPLEKIVTEALGSDHLGMPAQLDERWPTFAGSPSRSRIAPGPIDVGSLQWRVDLDPPVPAQFRRSFGRGLPGLNNLTAYPDRPLAYHPIVLGDQVIVCNEKEIVAYNLNDRPGGSMTGPVPIAWKHEHQPMPVQAAQRQLSSMPRYTLTAYGDRIYARLGPQGPMINRGFNPAQVSSVLVAVDRSTQGKLLWSKQSNEIALPLPQADGRFAGFEGTPVADARHVYVALTEGGVQSTTYVACLDADTGSTLWVRYIFQANPGLDNGMGPLFMTDLSHRLLTLEGSTVYYQTNLGAVAALDAESGRIRWLATYPRQERGMGQPRERDLNPAVVQDNRVMIAPDDSQRLFAFDAASGRLLWQTRDLADVAHVLGVSRGRLIATGNHVYSIDVKDGKVVSCWPDNDAGIEGFGRGVLAGDYIYWPTKTDIQVLDQATGVRADRPPIKLQELFQTGGGNLAVGDGYLIVAQPDALVVFCQNSRLIERYREIIAQAPDQAAGYFRLAQAAEATKQDKVALENLAEAIRKARPSEAIDGQPLLDTARDHLHRLLMKLAAQAVSERDWVVADQRYEEAAQAARLDRDRLAARFRLADVQAERGEPARAVETLQSLLAEERLRSLNVPADEHRTVRADLLITDRLEALIRQWGRGLYATFDREADRLLKRGKAEKDARLLEEVSRSYPVARAVPDSLLALGQLSESVKKPADAAHAYKRLLALGSSDSERARALWGLANAFEQLELWVPARDVYLQAQLRFGDQKVDGDDSEVRLAQRVAERLAREPFSRMTGDRSEPSLPVPLSRLWSRQWKTEMRPLAADGVPPSAAAGRIFVVERSTLRPVDPRTGEEPWKADLGEEPIWAGYLADRVIVGTLSKLVALNLETGKIEWRSDLETPRVPNQGLNPFAKPEPGGQKRTAAQGHLAGFRIVGSRVFCLRGDKELLAFDGDSGLIDWAFTPSAGTLNAHLSVGPERIIVQVRQPNEVLVLDTASGRTLAEFHREEDGVWPRDPVVIDDDHIALVTDRRTVALFDLKRGVYSWVFRESPGLPRNGPPRLLGDGERLLVLYDGTELIRLDSRTGGRLWGHPLGSEDLSERPEALALDGERFYCVTSAGGGQDLKALALADGALVWQRHLSGPEAGWAIALSDRYLSAFPTPAGTADGRLESLPIVFCRRETGNLVQRVLLPAQVSQLTVRLAPRSAMIVTQAGAWALGGRGSVDAVQNQ